MKTILIFLASLLFVTSLVQAQNYRDKAAEEKAELDKQAQYKEEQGKNWNEPANRNSTDKNRYNDSQQNDKNRYNDPPQNNDRYNKPNAQAQFIPCPVNQIEARITSSIPSDWWDTPQQGGLRNTRVTDIGGSPTLQCLYWAYDREIPLMKRAPAGMRCTAQSNGFRCE